MTPNAYHGGKTAGIMNVLTLCCREECYLWAGWQWHDGTAAVCSACLHRVDARQSLRSVVRRWLPAEGRLDVELGRRSHSACHSPTTAASHRPARSRPLPTRHRPHNINSKSSIRRFVRRFITTHL